MKESWNQSMYMERRCLRRLTFKANIDFCHVEDQLNSWRSTARECRQIRRGIIPLNLPDSSHNLDIHLEGHVGDFFWPPEISEHGQEGTPITRWDNHTPDWNSFSSDEAVLAWYRRINIPLYSIMAHIPGLIMQASYVYRNKHVIRISMHSTRLSIDSVL